VLVASEGLVGEAERLMLGKELTRSSDYRTRECWGVWRYSAMLEQERERPLESGTMPCVVLTRSYMVSYMGERLLWIHRAEGVARVLTEI
jgi:hypothetical protein